MRGSYVIVNSKSQVVGFGYDLWDTNEEAIKNLSEQYETIKKVFRRIIQYEKRIKQFE